MKKSLNLSAREVGSCQLKTEALCADDVLKAKYCMLFEDQLNGRHCGGGLAGENSGGNN